MSARFQELCQQARVLDQSGAPLAAYPFSEQQRRVIRGVLAAQETAQIAAELEVSIHTVKDHLSRIYKIAGVNSRLKLALKFMERS